MKIAYSMLLVLAFSAQASGQEDFRMINFYAKDNGVSMAVAKERLMLHSLAGSLQSRIGEDPWFGGMYIANSPEFQVIVQSTDPTISPKDFLKKKEHALTPYIRIVGVDKGLAVLREDQVRAIEILKDANVAADVDIDIAKHFVDVRAVDSAKAHSALVGHGLDKVRVTTVSRLSEPLAGC